MRHLTSYLTPCFMALLLCLPLCLPLALAAEERDSYWPQWRGPDGDGVASHANPPTTWSEGENVRLKVAIPGRGQSTPVIWGDSIFLLTAIPVDEAALAASEQAAADKLANQQWPPAVTPVEQRFVVMALSRHDGSVQWQHTAVQQVPEGPYHVDASWASASPVTDGERLFAFFGSQGLFAYTLDGKPLWSKDLGTMETRAGFGEGASPALHDGILVVNWDHEKESFIVAFDAATGEELWRQPRPEEPTSWSTPLIVETAGVEGEGSKTQVIVAATGASRGYDLKTGTEIWRASGMTTNAIPSPVQRDGVVYLTSGFRGSMLQAVSLAQAKGDVSEGAAMLWSHDKDTPYVPSPVLYDGNLYFLKSNGNILSVLDATTGESRHLGRLEGLANVYASPVAAAGHIYFLSREGKTAVLRAGATPEVIAVNELDDGFEASPAIAGDELYLRGRKYLYVIGETETAEPAHETRDAATGR